MSSSDRYIQVVPYTYENFCDAVKRGVARRVKGSPTPESRKYPLKYFESYFRHFLQKGPITLVVESSYIDRYFMEDYAGYYARCFPGTYTPLCTRIHFFNTKFSESDFRKSLLDAEPLAQLRDKYLGYAIVKPLPQTFIGRTFLKTYEAEAQRHYPVIYKTEAHLCGATLPIASIPFQQQDTVVAACATSALWSVFHGTGMLFHHHIPSPVEITKIATTNSASAGRAFPSQGLTVQQMCDVIRHVGLEPELIEIHEKWELQAYIYSYLQAGIPAIMLAGLYDTSVPDKKAGGPSYIGFHAVAVTGYCAGNSKPEPLPEGPFLRATRINKLYVHDDQIGPFARLEFTSTTAIYQHGCRVTNKGNSSVAVWQPPPPAPAMLTSSWRGTDGKESVIFVPEVLIIPLYHKIRLSFPPVVDTITSIDRALRKTQNLMNLEWDVFLTTTQQLKADVIARYKSRLSRSRLMDILYTPQPHYIWRAIAFHKRAPLLELWFDATDVEQGEYLFRVLPLDSRLSYRSR